MITQEENIVALGNLNFFVAGTLGQTCLSSPKITTHYFVVSAAHMYQHLITLMPDFSSHFCHSANDKPRDLAIPGSGYVIHISCDILQLPETERA